MCLCVWSTPRDLIAGVVQTREMSPSRCLSVQPHYSQRKHNTVPSENTPRSRACPCTRMQMNPSSALFSRQLVRAHSLFAMTENSQKSIARLSCPPPPPSQEPTKPTAFRLRHIAAATHQSLFALKAFSAFVDLQVVLSPSKPLS